MPLWILLTVASIQQILMGGTYAFARYVLLLTDPFAVAFIRYVIAGAVLGLIVWTMNRRTGVTPIAPEDRKKIIILGLVIIGLNQTLYLYGQKYTTAAHGSLLFATTPIFVYLMAMKHLGEKWAVKKGIGILLAVVGSAFIVFEKGLQFNYEILKGDLIIMAAVVAWAYYSVWGKPLVEKYGAFRMTAYALGSGAIAYFPFGLYKILRADLSGIDTFGWVSILYIALITSVFGYSVWYWLLKYMEAGRASVLTNIQPIVAGFFGLYILSEPLTLPFIIGGVIILAGVTITQKA